MDTSSYNEELELLYRPQMNYICRIIECSIFGITIVLVMLAAYVIVKKSTTTMGQYKYLLLNQLAWNFFFDTILILWQPIPVFNAENGQDLNYRFLMVYSNGIFRYSGPNSFYATFVILFIVIIGMTHSLYFNMIYRVLAVFYDSKLGRLIQEPIWLRRIFFGSLVVAIVLFGYPLFVAAFYLKNVQVLYNNSIKAMPAMKDVIRLEPSTNGCDMPTCGTLPMYLQGVQIGLAVLALPTSIFVIGAIYERRMRYLKKQNMTQATMKLNQMLMKALCIHIGIIIVFLVIPVMVLVAIMLFGNEKHNIISEIIIVIFTWHSLFDIPVMLYFITPYRKFILTVLWNALQTVGLDKFMKNKQIIPVQQQMQISLGIISSQK